MVLVYGLKVGFEGTNQGVAVLSTDAVVGNESNNALLVAIN